MSNIRPNALGRALRGFFTDDLPQVRGIALRAQGRGEGVPVAVMMA